MRQRITLLACLLFTASLIGCTTSAQFRAGAARYGPDVVTDATRYVNADTTLDPATKATRLQQLADLQSSTADVKTVSRSKVTAAWAAVEAWYLAYVDADTKANANEKSLRHDAAQRFDKVIADDAARPFSGG